jgi:hypothetical protein
MKIDKKIEKILDINGAVWTPPAPKNKRKALKELSTLIQEERKDAVEGFITDFIETGVYEGVGSIEDIMKLWRKYNAHN